MKTEVLEIDINDKASIDRALARIDKIKDNIDHINDRIKQLADMGVEVASAAFLMALLNRDNNAYCKVSTVANENGYSILAEGRQIAFMEFGTGVYYNGNGSYPGEIPDGIVGIGEYGKGQGKNDEWFNPFGAYMTHGQYRTAGMYEAYKTVVEQAVNIIEEIFND